MGGKEGIIRARNNGNGKKQHNVDFPLLIVFNLYEKLFPLINLNKHCFVCIIPPRRSIKAFGFLHWILLVTMKLSPNNNYNNEFSFSLQI